MRLGIALTALFACLQFTHGTTSCPWGTVGHEYGLAWYVSAPIAGTAPELSRGGLAELNGGLHFFGGVTGAFGAGPIVNEHHVYDISTRTWTDLTSPTAPRARQDFKMAALDNALYVFGGRPDNGGSKCPVCLSRPHSASGMQRGKPARMS